MCADQTTAHSQLASSRNADCTLLRLPCSPPPATLDPAQASPLTALFTSEAAEPASLSVWRNLARAGLCGTGVVLRWGWGKRPVECMTRNRGVLAGRPGLRGTPTQPSRMQDKGTRNKFRPKHSPVHRHSRRLLVHCQQLRIPHGHSLLLHLPLLQPRRDSQRRGRGLLRSKVRSPLADASLGIGSRGLQTSVYGCVAGWGRCELGVNAHYAQKGFAAQQALPCAQLAAPPLQSTGQKAPQWGSPPAFTCPPPPPFNPLSHQQPTRQRAAGAVHALGNAAAVNVLRKRRLARRCIGVAQQCL